MSKSDSQSSAVIFGGTGFIGMFLADEIIKRRIFKKVYIVDIERIDDKSFEFRKNQYQRICNNIDFYHIDLREDFDFPVDGEIVIFNLAAVHREPGHDPHEYFETNIKSAKNIIKWSKSKNCREIIFLSSISPYGPTENEVSELSIPMPSTPYGISKLSSEFIHKEWKLEDSDRKLSIFRPGVVFGPGEGGNLSRLIKAIKKNYFVFIGNKQKVKAGIYIKELVNAILWSRNKIISEHSNFIVCNLTLSPSPSLGDYVNSIKLVGGYKYKPPSIPFKLVLLLSKIIKFLADILHINQPIDPVRINKLIVSNNVDPLFLKSNGYEFTFTLEDAFRDWKKEAPHEW